MLLFGGVFLALGLVWIGMQKPQPSYKGRTLREWAMIRAFSSSPEELVRDAEDGIRQIGTNGLPTVMNWIIYNPEDNPVGVFREKLSRLPLPELVRDGLRKPFVEAERLDMCLDVVFFVLNTNAAPAIPALVEIAKTNRNWVATHRATHALWRIGPQTIPELIEIINDPNSRARADAVYVLGILHLHEPTVAPLFLKYAQDPDRDVSANAVECLERKINPPQDTIPVLIAALGATHLQTRVKAARALGRYGVEALSAVPELEANLLNSDYNVRIESAVALGKIAPRRFTNSVDQIFELYGLGRSPSPR